MLRAGALRHLVTLYTLSAPVSDGDGGYTQTPTALATRIPAAVMPATATDIERVIANTVASEASHLVTIRYLSGVTTKTRLVYHDGSTDRTFSITGVVDEGERHIALVLACIETTT